MKFTTLIITFIFVSLINSFQGIRILNYQETKILTKPEIINEDIIKGKTLEYLSVIKNNHNKFEFSTNKGSQNIISEINFKNEIQVFGWDKLSIKTHNSANIFTQYYFSGFLEGIITQKKISQFFSNTFHNNSIETSKKSLAHIFDFFEKVGANLLKKFEALSISKGQEHDKQLFLAFQQLIGLFHGYNFVSPDKEKLTIGQLLFIQAESEIPELIKYFKKNKSKLKLGVKNYFKKGFNIKTQDPNIFWGKLISKGRCSAFIKLVNDPTTNKYTELLSGHSTWSSFSEFIRIYKYYSFGENKAIFSSYPGCLSSTDDFYLTNHNLLIMETTIEVVDLSLYKNELDENDYIPSFMRVLQPTFFAKSAKEWVEIFNKNKVGSYSSQWMILDYNIFEKEVKGKTHTEAKNVKQMFYILEEIPNQIEYHDISKFLFKHSYFGSYNRTFLSSSKKSLNQKLIENLYGERFSYKLASRALIFSHYAKDIKTLKDMDFIMRYNGYLQENDWKEDPSRKSPSKGISARFDLEKKSLFELSGGVDSKITNLSLIKTMSSIAVAGPSRGNNKKMKPFDWNDFKDSKEQHEGVPQKIEFEHVIMSPSTIDKTSEAYKLE